jgi:hypothetical protein
MEKEKRSQVTNLLKSSSKTTMRWQIDAQKNGKKKQIKIINNEDQLCAILSPISPFPPLR